MTQEHPITPPPELVKQWVNKHYGCRVDRDPVGVERTIATKAARWGADQELEACCEWLVKNDWKAVHKHLRDARRPKPPSLQDQALDDLERIAALLMKNNLPCDTGNIRRALEALPD